MSSEEDEAAGGTLVGVYENETRPENMVSLLKHGQITVRMATFLKPTATNEQEAFPIPNHTPLLHETLPRDHQRWPNSKVIFRGWNCPQKNWKLWVDRLAPKYSPTWIQAGIYDAILSSTFEFRCNQPLVLGLSEYWCPATNTFVFQWGEATVTLEDVMILCGYPVHGESVTARPQILSQELTEIEAKLMKYRTQVARSRANKVAQGEWIKFFMENETECEHAAFLSLWLSRFLFPNNSDIVAKDVHAIAVKLSLGIRVALAPAVLASLYRDLRKLTQEAMASSRKILLLAPFQLLQIWAFERFPKLAPQCPNSIQPGEPRMARWHKLNLNLTMLKVKSVFEVAKNFQWRPYVANVKNWNHPSYYKETDQLVSDYSSIKEDDGLLSFLRIVQATELVGMNCRENYSPHRVAMQFGMDQDLPGQLNKLDVSKEVVDFYIPPRTYQPGVTERYSNWWKDSLVVRENAMKHVLSKKKELLNSAHQKDADNSQIDHRKHKALYLRDDLESCTQQPDAAIGPSQSNNSIKASNECNLEDSNQPITISSSEDSDDDHLPISTCLRKSPHTASTIASQTSESSKRKLPSSHEEQNSQKKVFRSKVDSVLEPLTKSLAMNTDSQPMNGRVKIEEEDETSTDIKANEAYVIDIPDEFQMEARISRLERIVARLKAVKAARALEKRKSLNEV